MEIVTGIIAGCVSGLGMGGGTILILVLVNFLGIDQHIAQATNLIFYIPTAIVACIVNYKNKIINIKQGNKIALFGILGAILGANLSFKISSQNLKKYFGIFLLIIAIYEIYVIIKQYKTKKDNK